MIRTKKELITELNKTKSSELDKIIEYHISEEVLRGLIKELEEDDIWWGHQFAKVMNDMKKLKKEVSYWKGIYKGKLKREKEKEDLI